MEGMLIHGCAIASYASSFGIEAIDDDAIIGDMRRCLSRYRSIYVRERSGVDIVESMGLQAAQVLDPVFLLRDQWQQFVHSCQTKKKYCLVYALIDYGLFKKMVLADHLSIFVDDVSRHISSKTFSASRTLFIMRASVPL